MRNVEMQLKHYGITLNQDNSNLLILGKTGTGKSYLINKLIESIKHEFILIENRGAKKGEGFLIYPCRDGWDIGGPQGITESSPEHIGNLSDLEMRLIKEVEERELVDKEKLIPMLVVMDELDFLLSERYKNELSSFEYKSRLNHYMQKGSETGIYFILTSQSKDISAISKNLFITQIETEKVNSKFIANCSITIDL